ncbi:MAG: hypothetical protein OEL79_03545 [Chromatiales bacterium]|nr:hypothetical protein [Chromatiales bacterium]
MHDYTQITVIVALWCGFFALHSLTASLTLKHWVANHYAGIMPAYRLIFNGLSTLLLIPLLLLSYSWRSEPLWQWNPPLFWITSLISAITVIAFIISIRYYDMSEFFGTRQWRKKVDAVEDQENFVIGDFHRYVRHPWYSMGIILIWCRELDLIMLTNAIMITLYFIIGSRLEERKLVQYHGKIYHRYQQKVPGLMPRPWKFLTRLEADELIKEKM